MKKEKAKVDKKNTIEKENKTNATDETLEQEMEKKKVPKQVSQEILKKIFKNLILAIVVMIYFISCNILYTQLEWEQMETITKAVSGVFLLASIISLEFAYKRDSGTLTMTAIELLVLAIHALFIDHVVTIYQFDFRNYLITSSCIFVIYYALKSTVIYTRARIKYLKSLSDISEILKDEPVVKEAKKRNEEPIVEIEEQKRGDNEEKKQKTKSVKEKKKSKDKNAKKENHEEESQDENKKNEKENNTEEKSKKKQTTKKKSKIKEEKEIEKKEIQEKGKTIKTSNKEEKNENVSKTKRKTKQNKEKKQEKPKAEQQNEPLEEKKSKKIKEIEEVKKQPKSKRGRKKKEEVVKDD